MPRLVLTVIGDDRAGLVEALSQAVNAHGGNWEESQLSELAGKFAGIVVVSAPTDRLEGLSAALRDLDGLLAVEAHPGTDADAPEDARQVTLDLIGNDHPGIVRDVSSVLARHGLSIDTLETGTRDAPMAGGRLFEAHVVVTVPADGDLGALRADLERLATELVVDLSLTDA